MAYSFAQITACILYKGHRIETVESPMQIVYMVDGHRERCFWSIADAKRAINCQPTKFYSVDIQHWFRDGKESC